jgi:uncharacterized protein DUF4339
VNIYIAKDGKQAGPFSDEQIRSMLNGGLISDEDLGWREGIGDWQPIGVLMGAPQPPPLPPRLKPVEHPVRRSLTKEPPRGIGGWLLFFCVSLTILGPLLAIYQINENWTRALPAFQAFPALKVPILVENWGNVALVLYGFIVGCLIWNGVPSGKYLAQEFLILRFLLFIGMELLTLSFVRDLPRAAIIGHITSSLRYPNTWFVRFATGFPSPAGLSPFSLYRLWIRADFCSRFAGVVSVFWSEAEAARLLASSLIRKYVQRTASCGPRHPTWVRL